MANFIKPVVREACQADAAMCSEVLCASIRELCVADHHGDEQIIKHWLANKTPETVESWIQSSESTIYVAESDHQIAGIGGVSGSEVALNYVAPNYQGRGISTALLDAMESALRDRGVSTAELNSTATAHEFYLRSGWIDSGEPVASLGILGYPMTKVL